MAKEESQGPRGHPATAPCESALDSEARKAETACYSSAENKTTNLRAETLRAWRYVMDETYESPEESKDD
jgi:hypothetical protein